MLHKITSVPCPRNPNRNSKMIHIQQRYVEFVGQHLLSLGFYWNYPQNIQMFLFQRNSQGFQSEAPVTMSSPTMGLQPQSTGKIRMISTPRKPSKTDIYRLKDAGWKTWFLVFLLKWSLLRLAWGKMKAPGGNSPLFYESAERNPT